MDMREHMGRSFVRLDDVRDQPRKCVIRSVRIGQYGPVAEFYSDESLTLNTTNVRTLAQAYGHESQDWHGVEVELYVGQTKYKGQMQDSVLVRPISPPKKSNGGTLPPPPDDEVPF